MLSLYFSLSFFCFYPVSLLPRLVFFPRSCLGDRCSLVRLLTVYRPTLSLCSFFIHLVVSARSSSSQLDPMHNHFQHRAHHHVHMFSFPSQCHISWCNLRLLWPCSLLSRCVEPAVDMTHISTSSMRSFDEHPPLHFIALHHSYPPFSRIIASVDDNDYSTVSSVLRRTLCGHSTVHCIAGYCCFSRHYLI